MCVSVCVTVCECLSVCVCVCTCASVYLCVYMCVCMCTAQSSKQVISLAYTCVCVSVCLVCVCMCVGVCVWVYVLSSILQVGDLPCMHVCVQERPFEYFLERFLLLIPFEENVNRSQCGPFSCAKISAVLRAVCVQSKNRRRVGWWRKF